MSDGRNINTGGGNYNERIEGNYVQGNYYAAQRQSFAEAAAEIQKLLEQLDKSYSTQTTAGKMAIRLKPLPKASQLKPLSTLIVTKL
ncbi:MAG: hypothetical protein PUP93_21005 [Rhizonema sp. NSF051]|nr:hypothetical protein [Rhizonema sp. NSF051]